MNDHQLYLIVFLHQTTTIAVFLLANSNIVSYRLSTSNHNYGIALESMHKIVSYRLSTSNHNLCLPSVRESAYCILSSFYIKPQLYVHVSLSFYDCILSSFYIKPQLVQSGIKFKIIVSYRLSTSNHNPASLCGCSSILYLIVFLHQTTTAVQLALPVI